MNFKLLIRRFFAFIIDWNMLYGVTFALLFFGPGSNPKYFLYPSLVMFRSLGFVLALVWALLYCLFKDCLFGRRSLGKLICGLIIRDAKTGEKPSFKSLILRNILYVPLVQVEAILVLANKGKRVGDIMANTLVVEKRKVVDK